MRISIEHSQGFAKFTLVQEFRPPKYMTRNLKKTEFTLGWEKCGKLYLH